MIAKPTILIFIDWFWPGYLAGGPIQSVLALVNSLNDSFNFKIITTNTDLNSEKKYENIEPNKWITSPLGCEIFYADSKKLNYTAIKKIINEVSFEIVYINSFFSKNYSIIPLIILNNNYKNIPVILAPRGMLGDGALALKKIKKKLFILFSKISGFHSKIIWHATSLNEEEEIKKTFHKKTNIVTISNLPKKLSANLSKSKQINVLKLCFISRISAKKNLIFALKVLSKIKEVEIIYNIYGPKEDSVYWEKCSALIKEMPSNVVINYKGLIHPNELEIILAEEQMMFLPTLNENFGHSIVESLFCGCPVIISDQTPWIDLEKNNAGFAIPLNNTQGFINAITKMAKLNQEDYLEKSNAAIKYISSKIEKEKSINLYKNLFNDFIKN